MTTTSKNFIHSCYFEKRDPHTKEKYSVLMIKEKILTKENENSEIQSKSNLRFIENPKRPFWITKKGLRTHTDKKEYEEEYNLDKYIVCQHDLAAAIAKVLNNTSNNKFYKLTEICNSPYVYGADVTVNVLAKMFYNSNCNKELLCEYISGGLDIETSVVPGDKRIIAITFTTPNKIYTSVLDDFLYKYDENDNKIKATVNDILELATNKFKDYIEKYKFEINVNVAKTEMDLITWIFDAIHMEELDFITIWNMNFDITYILDRLKENNVTPESIFSHPSVPLKYRYCCYSEDFRQNLSHFTDKWHVLHTTSHSKFIDAMSLYSRLRFTNQGRKSSYTLDAVMKEELGVGKETFGRVVTDHYYMQTKCFVEYTIYNMFDGILLQLHLYKNNDPATMMLLLGDSDIADYGKQTVMLKNMFYTYCRENKKICATSGNKMLHEYDDKIPAIGGTVLAPELAYNCGMKINNMVTLLSKNVYDIDFGGMYPNTIRTFNISKETLMSYILSVKDMDESTVEYIFSRLHSPRENAVNICEKVFALPNYEQMRKLYMEHCTNILQKKS